MKDDSDMEVIQVNLENKNITLLRNAGCKCKKPLIGFHIIGPRCRICNTQALFTSAKITQSILRKKL